jgi:DNA polymerase III delta prime subunit
MLLLNRYAPTSFDSFEKGGLIEMLINIGTMHVILVGGVGTGKTTLCNLILKKYYGTSAGKANVLYINNVKEQGVQYYRTEVKIFCQTTSTIPGKKKTIILDDMDVISEQGQQVFLTGLDTYGHSVNYIVTCRCQQNLIESIHSRLICIQLNPFDNEYLKRLLLTVAEKEKVSMDETAVSMCVARCNSSIRTLLNYVEKFKLLDEPITAETVALCCSNIKETYFDQLMEHIIKKETRQALHVVRAISDDGYSVMDILDAFFTFLKLTPVIDDMVKYKITKIVSKYICIFNQIHEHSVELLFFVNEIIQQL